MMRRRATADNPFTLVTIGTTLPALPKKLIAKVHVKFAELPPVKYIVSAGLSFTLWKARLS